MSRLSVAWRRTRIYRWIAAQRLPQLLIIGGQKCGTSALFKYLAQHPQFAPSLEKEVEFFNSDVRFSRGLNWYASQWRSGLSARTFRFEASPAYLIGRQVPQRIRHCLPKVRLVAVLRDPVNRAYSAWQMYRRQLAAEPEFYDRLLRDRYTPAETARIVRRTPAELEDFGLAVEREVRVIERGLSMDMSVVELGLYGPQLQRYFDVFPREQLLVLDSNDLRTNRVATLNRVLDFLGLPPWNWSHSDLSEVFVGHWTSSVPTRARDFLRNYYRASNRLLAELLDEPPLFVREGVHRRASA